jgi:hypothetical protein
VLLQAAGEAYYYEHVVISRNPYPAAYDRREESNGACDFSQPDVFKKMRNS